MLTGNEAYLDMARSALDFMYNYQWDSQYGGWYARCNSDGSNPELGNKTAFNQHYALLGITAFYEATGSLNDFEMLDSGYQFVDDYLWDNSTDYYGYYDEVSRTGSNPTGKSFNATVDAITTHLYNLYLITKDQKYYDRLMEVKNNIIDYLVASMDDQVIGFAEDYNTDWTINSGDRRTIMGHVLKTAWCLGRIYRINPEQKVKDAATKLVQNVLENGYDHKYGGPYKDYDRLTGEMYMYGAEDTAKAWWQMEQAITAGLMMYELTWQTQYKKMADESLDFFMNYFVDQTYGEVYADRSRTGGRVYYSGGYWDENKGSEWKAAYHSIETGYYSYIYGKLLIKREPVILYYRYNAHPEERIVNMNPVAVDFDKLKIESVTFNGDNYSSFDSTARTLTVLANDEGLYAVTYKMTDLPATSIEVIPEPISFNLNNYPNPFNTTTTIRFELARSSNVKLFVYNSSGQIIEQILDEEMIKGKHEITWNASDYQSGIYFYKIIVEGGSQTGKCILMK
jgi:mannose/cellobiose epimerase-like protein (N-acyl-D-glucosamine 2-epimerase family)